MKAYLTELRPDSWDIIQSKIDESIFPYLKCFNVVNINKYSKIYLTLFH